MMTICEKYHTTKNHTTHYPLYLPYLVTLKLKLKLKLKIELYTESIYHLCVKVMYSFSAEKMYFSCENGGIIQFNSICT